MGYYLAIEFEMHDTYNLLYIHRRTDFWFIEGWS